MSAAENDLDLVELVHGERTGSLVRIRDLCIELDGGKFNIETEREGVRKVLEFLLDSHNFVSRFSIYKFEDDGTFTAFVTVDWTDEEEVNTSFELNGDVKVWNFGGNALPQEWIKDRNRGTGDMHIGCVTEVSDETVDIILDVNEEKKEESQ